MDTPTMIAGASLIISAISLIINITRGSKKESQDIAVRLAVVEERISNEMDLLDKLEEKLDEIRKNL